MSNPSVIQPGATLGVMGGGQLGRMSALAAGRLGSLSPRYYGVPTEYSQRRTIEQDAPAILELLRKDQVDVALLVPL